MPEIVKKPIVVEKAPSASISDLESKSRDSACESHFDENIDDQGLIKDSIKFSNENIERT